MKTKRPKKIPDIINCKSISCRLIQWQRKKVPTDKKGNPVCPECRKPAEMILGFFGQPCWGHK